MNKLIEERQDKATHLSEKALAATELPKKERIEYLRKKKWFGYPVASSILDSLEDLLEYPKCPRMPNLLVVGDTNNGKTSLILEFLKRHPTDDNVDGKQVVMPVLLMQAPPVPDEGRFYDEILELLFAPYRSNEKIARKEREVLRLFKLIDVRMLIIDEIHNLIAGSMSRQQAILNAIKNLGNKLQIPIVGVGTKDAFRAIHSDDQLANRFKSAVIPKWEFCDEYRRLLSTFEHTLALKEPSGLSGEKIARELLWMSEGVIGELASIISEAAVYAVRHDQEKISLETLKKINWTLPSKRAKSV